MWLCENIWDVSDFVDWAALIGINVITLLYVMLVTPYCRPFDWNDPTISYPNLPNTFPVYSLGLMLIAALLFHTFFVKWMIKPLQRLVFRVNNHASYTSVANNINLSTSLNDYNNNINVPTSVLAVSSPVIMSGNFNEVESQFHAVYVWWRAQLWAFSLQFAITSFIKVYVGRLRPDYLARLASRGITQSAAVKHHYPDPHADPFFYCTLSFEHPTLYDGRLAFPSGHSSSSFAVCTLVSLFLIAHLRPFANQGSFVRLLISLSPLSVSFLCALSRTRDYKHGFSDVLAGSLIGIISAMVAFHMCIREVNDKRNVYVIRADTDEEEDEERYNPNYNTTEMTNINNHNNNNNNNNNYNHNNINKINKTKKRVSGQELMSQNNANLNRRENALRSNNTVKNSKLSNVAKNTFTRITNNNNKSAPTFNCVSKAAMQQVQSSNEYNCAYGVSYVNQSPNIGVGNNCNTLTNTSNRYYDNSVDSDCLLSVNSRNSNSKYDEFANYMMNSKELSLTNNFNKDEHNITDGNASSDDNVSTVSLNYYNKETEKTCYVDLQDSDDKMTHGRNPYYYNCNPNNKELIRNKQRVSDTNNKCSNNSNICSAVPWV